MALIDIFKKYEAQIELQPENVKKLLLQLKTIMEELDKLLKVTNENNPTS